METKNLANLIVKHFDFLTQEHGFEYDISAHQYSKEKLQIEVQHVSGELNVLFKVDKKSTSFEEVMSVILKRAFTYPDHFSSWVLSMGDVDSRLAYDAKLMKEHATKLFTRDLVL